MYSDKLAIAVKVNGKVLREFKDTAFVPFGYEYSLLIRNLNSVRCRVSISIDGKDIADGDSFIINANSSLEIERFLKNGNMRAGNRFKFIERTAGVEAHRGGAQVEDGIIRVEFEFEKELAPYKQHYPVWEPTPWVKPVWPKPYWYGSPGDITYGSIGGSSAGFTSNMNTLNDGHSASCSFTANSAGAASINCSAAATSDSMSYGKGIDGGRKPDASLTKSTVRARGFVPSAEEKIVNEAGITAPGSISNQQFHNVSDINGDGVKHAMVVRLVGEIGQNKITRPVTVSSKPKCTSCGRTNKSSSKFCVECGTSLVIV